MGAKTREEKLREKQYSEMIKSNYLSMKVELADKLIQALRKHDVPYPTIFCLSFPKDENHLEAIAGLIVEYFREQQML